jgi:hypothetical protein
MSDPQLSQPVDQPADDQGELRVGGFEILQPVAEGTFHAVGIVALRALGQDGGDFEG